MINGKESKSLILYSRTDSSDSDDNITTLTIPNDLAKELDIENCKVSMTVLCDFGGCKHLLVSKFRKEIVLN
jgi:hypothetical protein